MLYVRSWSKLTTLNLSDCLLRPKGGLSIMSTLDQGSSPLLSSLKLQSNELNAPAISTLASAIAKHLPNLIDLELNGNFGDSEDDCFVSIQEALEKWGHGDALDELDELEEEDEELEEEEDEEVQDEDDEIEDREEATIVEGEVETGGEDVRANEAEVVQEDKVAEDEDEPKPASTKEDADLAGLLGMVHIV